jgi:hypothetical protein
MKRKYRIPGIKKDEGLVLNIRTSSIITIQMAETKRKRNPFAMATTAPSVTPSRKNKGSPNARRVLFNSSAKTKVHQAVDMVSEK